MPPKEDLLMKMIPGNSPWSRLRRWFLSTRIASRKHPFTQYCLKSTQVIDYEISRHLKSHPYMIHPFSCFRSVASFYKKLKTELAKSMLVSERNWIDKISYVEYSGSLWWHCLSQRLCWSLQSSSHFILTSTRNGIFSTMRSTPYSYATLQSGFSPVTTILIHNW